MKCKSEWGESATAKRSQESGTSAASLKKIELI